MHINHDLFIPILAGITQVCLPGLHITLGVVFKFVQLYEIFARDIDFRIAAEIAKETRINIVDEMNCASVLSNDFDEYNYSSVLKEVADEVLVQQNFLAKLIKAEVKVNGVDFNLCEKSVDTSLKSIGVDRQAYYGGTIIGNHCHQLLKPRNVDTVFSRIPEIVLEQKGDVSCIDLLLLNAV